MLFGKTREKRKTRKKGGFIWECTLKLSADIRAAKNLRDGSFGLKNFTM